MTTVYPEDPTNPLQRQKTWLKMQELERQQRVSTVNLKLISRENYKGLTCQPQISRMSTQSMFSGTKSRPSKKSQLENRHMSSMTTSSQDYQSQPESFTQSMTEESSSRKARTFSLPHASHLSIEVPPVPVQQVKIQTPGEQTTIAILDDDAASDASSLCHSPSWSDYNTKKNRDKKKAKALKELEKERKKQEKENRKSTQRASTMGLLGPKKLSKGPPPSRPGLFARTATAPAITVVSELPEPISWRKSMSRPSLFQSRSESVPAAARRSSDVDSSRQSLSAEGGFVGGLKLRMLENETVQENIADQKHRQSHDLPIQGTATPRQYLDAAQRSSMTQPLPSLQKESDATSSASNSSSKADAERRTYASRIASEASLVENHRNGEVSDRSENGRRHNSERYSIAGAYQTAGSENGLDAARREKIRQAVLADIQSARNSSREPAKPTGSHKQAYSVSSISPVSQHESFTNSRLTMESASEDHASAIPGHDDELSSSMTESSDDEPSEPEDTYHSFVTQSYIAPELSFGSKQLKSRNTIGGDDNNATNPMLAGLKKAARTAFHRNSTATSETPSPVEGRGILTPSETAIASPRPSSARSKSGNKADRIFGEAVTPPLPPRLEDFSEIVGGSLSSSSTTDHSEGRSSPEALHSNVTTPTTSRPHSHHPPHKHAPPQQLQFDFEPSAPNGKEQPPSSASDPLYSERTSEDEEVQPTLMRNKSITKSQSTPYLKDQVADLSFLPELKHQALTKPALRTSVTDSVLSTDSRRDKRKEKEVIMVPSPSIVKSLPRSEVPALTAASSTYLRDARLSIAMQTPQQQKALHHLSQSKPGRTSMGSSSSLISNATPPQDQPIAKMFVICCSCKFFHDLPSKIYEAMSKGPSVVQDMDLGVSGLIKTQVSW